MFSFPVRGLRKIQLRRTALGLGRVLRFCSLDQGSKYNFLLQESAKVRELFPKDV